jgi:hypothetical protein
MSRWLRRLGLVVVGLVVRTPLFVGLGLTDFFGDEAAHSCHYRQSGWNLRAEPPDAERLRTLDMAGGQRPILPPVRRCAAFREAHHAPGTA